MNLDTNIILLISNLSEGVAIVAFASSQLTLRRGYYNHAFRQVAYLFNKVIICIHEHAVVFVQVYILDH